MTSPDEQYANALGELAAETDKADFDMGTVCETLEPVFAAGSHMSRLLYFQGTVASLSAGYQGFKGQDWVWDLYHHEATVSSYQGRGLSLPGGEATAYVGLGFGAQNTVTEWNGHFNQFDVSAQIAPLLSAGLNCFCSSVDHNDDDFIVPDEIVWPLLCGCSAGLSVSGTLFPIGGGVQKGLWQNNPYATRQWAAQDSDIAGHLESDADGNLLIRYGDASQSHIRRAYYVARSILRKHGTEPTSAAAAALSLALGALRDSGLSYDALCGPS